MKRKFDKTACMLPVGNLVLLQHKLSACHNISMEQKGGGC